MEPHNLHRTTLAQLVDQFDVVCEAAGLSPATRIFYRDGARQLSAYLRDVEGLDDPDPDEITVEHLSAFLANRRRTVSAASARSRFNALRPWFRWMTRRGFITLDPFTAGLSRPRVSQPVMPIPTADAVEALIDSIAVDDFLGARDRAMVLVLADTGLRRAELVAVRIADVGLVVGTIHVVAGKGGKGRVVPFGDRTRAAIRDYTKARGKLLAKRERPDPGFLFLDDSGYPMKSNAVHQMLDRRTRRAGIDLGGPLVHGFRRFAAHSQLAAGDSPLDVAARLGHSSIQMTAKYGQALAAERAVASFRSPLDAARGR